MNKALIILLLTITIFALIAFDNSFISTKEYHTVSGTSAVVLAKTDQVSVRSQFTITPFPNTTVNLTFSDGTEKQITKSYTFEVLLPKTSSFKSVSAGLQSGLEVNDQQPFDTSVISSSEDYFNSLISRQSDYVQIYWFKIQGQASVSIFCYGGVSV